MKTHTTYGCPARFLHCRGRARWSASSGETGAEKRLDRSCSPASAPGSSTRTGAKPVSFGREHWLCLRHRDSISNASMCRATPCSSCRSREGSRPFTGKSKDFADVQRCARGAAGSYHELGYSAVQVVLPDRLEQGVIGFGCRAALGKVTVTGTSFSTRPTFAAAFRISRKAPHERRVVARVPRSQTRMPRSATTVLLRSGGTRMRSTHHTSSG